jgi:hypothetical protein
MEYVRVVLHYNGEKYEAEVNSSSTPNELAKLFMGNLREIGEDLSEDNDYALIALSSFTLSNDSEWELVAKAKPVTVRKFGKLPKNE